MKSKRSLMTVLVGLAMLATPITAAAFDARLAPSPANVSLTTERPVIEDMISLPLRAPEQSRVEIRPKGRGRHEARQVAAYRPKWANHG